jgi:CDP-glycerol glycerophosphotransferase (TagB/SpsB family)
MIAGTLGRLLGAAGSTLLWFLCIPLRLLIPRRPDWVAVLGRGDGTFVDNCKYFYLAAQGAPGSCTVYVSGKADVVSALEAAGLPVEKYPSLRGAWFLLRAGAAVVDTTEWTQRGRYALLSGSRVFQLWHGVGFKRIELDRWRREHSNKAIFNLRCAIYRLSGRLYRYYGVLTTSNFYARELFQRAFLSDGWLSANYPRNTFGRLGNGDVSQLALLGADREALGQIRDWKEAGLRTVLIAPTFRDDGTHSLPIDDEERLAIERFCRDHGVRFVIKMHPLDRSEVLLPPEIAIAYAAKSDVYPALGEVSALVTDYSSIYMDFLAADRPIVFHVPDRDRYIGHRDIQFDLDDMTPGPKSHNWHELLRHMAEQLQHDTYSDARARLRSLAFDDNDPAEAASEVLRYLGLAPVARP